MAESPLRAAIEGAATEHGLSLDDLTVMSCVTDPFRLDTPANHRNAKWLADITSIQGLKPAPLFDSDWSFVEGTQRLRQSRSYESGGAS